MTERDGVDGDNHENDNHENDNHENHKHEAESGVDGRDDAATSRESGTPFDSADLSETDLTAGQEAERADSELTDLSSIQADDALLDALGGADSRVADGLGDHELSALLLAWRRDVDSEALPELVDTDTAVTTVKTAAVARNARGRSRRRMLVPVAAAAAVLAIGFTGTALAARDAQPGDTLWGLSKVLYADHARSVEAAASVRTDLEAAYLAIAQQRYEDARAALDEAEEALQGVTGEDELAKLRARHTELMAQLDEPENAPEVPPNSSSHATSSTAEPDTSTPSGSVPESSQHSVPPELDETSSIPTTEPPSSTEPTSPPTTTEDSPSEDESGSRSDTSVSREGWGLTG
ncbi:anti-sigma-D factor RsdA [Saccharomonospora azurea]|uniref:Anti-sigma-D factor RsdA sigma factor binding region domain-containing protein n=1 Tax=Saccharomonospora azurea NA-128 TaxID=882081 RepID=H8G4U0_9PSEU|nr:anti-sigma-D factor RsdA [Saccharomonospora azurea]EHY90157.1 hypothetical protein SacazDRAFT_03280 [Saccharomonospora azurea NA-128]